MEKEARSRRALAGARQRRQRAQTAAQAIADTHAPLINEHVAKAKKLVEEKTKNIKIPAMAAKKPEDILAASGDDKKDI